MFRELRKLVDAGLIEATGKAYRLNQTSDALLQWDLARAPHHRPAVRYDPCLFGQYRPGTTFLLPDEQRSVLERAGHVERVEQARDTGKSYDRVLQSLMIDLTHASSNLENVDISWLDTKTLIEFDERPEGLTPVAVWTIGPRRGLWIAPGVAHELQPIGLVSMRCVYFEPGALPFAGTECRVLDVSPLLAELVETTVSNCDGQDDERYGLVMPLLLKEMRDARRASAASLALPHDRRLRQVCESLIMEPACNEPLAIWGERVGASERTLARLFREETGLTFLQWRQQLRLVESMSRLARGTSVAAVSSELGYGNSSAFIAMFKKATGHTPQRYLKG